jgi:ketosteroid isomerase-like protein
MLLLSFCGYPFFQLSQKIIPFTKNTFMATLSKLSIIVFIIFITVACNNAAVDSKPAETTPSKDSTPAFDLAKAKSAIEAENAKFMEATRKGDSLGMAANYSDDAMILPPNSEAIPKAAITSFWNVFIKMGVKDVNLSIVDISGNADQLAETGTYEIFGDKNKSLEKGKYIVVWKPVNGVWKMYRDIFNSSMPVAKK